MNTDRNGKPIQIGTKVVIIKDEGDCIPVGSIGYVRRIKEKTEGWPDRDKYPVHYDVRQKNTDNPHAVDWMGWFDPDEIAVIDE